MSKVPSSGGVRDWVCPVCKKSVGMVNVDVTADVACRECQDAWVADEVSDEPRFGLTSDGRAALAMAM